MAIAAAVAARRHGAPQRAVAARMAFVSAMLGLATCAQAEDLDVPYVTTPPNVVEAMLSLAKVKAGDFVLDLGSGDGRIVISAATSRRARGMGVEIDPKLVELSNENASKAGVADRVRFVEQDLFKTDLSPASVITMYLLPDVNLKLRPALLRLKPGTRIVSHDWDMGDWQPDAKVVLDAPDKKLGLRKESTLMLWKVPASAEGSWTAGRVLAMDLTQRYQMLTGTVHFRGRAYPQAAGRVDGERLELCFERQDATHCKTGASGSVTRDGLRLVVDGAGRAPTTVIAKRR